MTSLPLVNLWNRRSLILEYAIMNIKMRYKGTFLGFLWAAIEPLIMFTILYVVFTGIRVERNEYFAIYLITGVLLYHSFVRGTQSGVTILGNNLSILNSINVRREFFPVVSTVSTLLLLLVEVGVLFMLMPVFHFIPSYTILLLIPLLTLFILLVLGLTYILSITYVFAKDIHPIWGVFSYGLMFVSPIFWYLKGANWILSDIQQINPIGQLIEIGHKVVFGQDLPTLYEWLYVSAFVFGILFIGYVLFQKFEKLAAERV